MQTKAQQMLAILGVKTNKHYKFRTKEGYMYIFVFTSKGALYTSRQADYTTDPEKLTDEYLKNNHRQDDASLLTLVTGRFRDPEEGIKIMLGDKEITISEESAAEMKAALSMI